MRSSPDWVGFVLDRPLSDFPGSRFVYNSGGSHLLSAAVQGAMGMTTERFAAANLFQPLGIERWYWEVDPQGISVGGWGLWLKPSDLARFGYLYLNEGRWVDKQVVPSAWVTDSCSRQISAGQPWLSDYYGYQWWVDRLEYTMALGAGGQYVILVPKRNLIMITTSGLRLTDFFAPENLLNDYILPASGSNLPLPANPAGVATLKERISALADPGQPYPAPSLPDMALRISDRIYQMLPSPVGWTRISLSFREGQSSAVFTADDFAYHVGLDGMFRVTNPPSTLQVPKDAVRMLRGRWTDANTFVIEFLIAGRTSSYMETLFFQGDELFMREDVYISGDQYYTSGRAPVIKIAPRKK
jgi:hypothetical protein